MMIEETLVEDVDTEKEEITVYYHDVIEPYGHTVRIYIGSTEEVLRVKAYCTVCSNKFIKDFYTGCEEIIPYLKALPLSLFDGECNWCS